MKNVGNSSRGVVRESRRFRAPIYIGRIARSSLRQHSFLVVFASGHFYRAMHLSAYARSWDRMSSVCPSVCPSVCDVGDL